MPNILLLMCDQLTARVMRLYGGPVAMPNVERLAAEGVVFDRAYAASVACGPSRACLFTGQYPHHHGIAHNVDLRDYATVPWRDRLPETEEGIKVTDRTLGRTLREAGWQTHHYGKWHLLDDDLPWYPDMYTEKDYLADMRETFARYAREAPLVQDWCGWLLPVTQSPAMQRAIERLGDRWRDRIFEPFATRIGRLDMPLEQTFDARVVDRTVAWLERGPTGPFALTCSLIWPHDPYVIPSPYYEMYDPDEIDLPASVEQWETRFADDWPREFVRALGKDGLREWLRIYYGAIRLVDDQVGRVLDALDRSGWRDDTIVVFTTDHGDMAGAHGMAWKNTPALYEDIIRIPLVIRAPGLLDPGRRDVLTANVDLMPTLLSLAGAPIPTTCDGRDLVPVLAGDAPEPEFVVCEVLDIAPGRVRHVGPDRSGHFAIRADRWKYVHYPDGDYLYDLRADPLELHDRSAAEPEVVANWRDTLAEWLQETGAPFPLP